MADPPRVQTFSHNRVLPGRRVPPRPIVVVDPRRKRPPEAPAMAEREPKPKPLVPGEVVDA